MKKKTVKKPPALSPNPQTIDEETWYYEMRPGITIVHEIRSKITNDWIRTDQFTIPWRKLETSLNRKRGTTK